MVYVDVDLGGLCGFKAVEGVCHWECGTMEREWAFRSGEMRLAGLAFMLSVALGGRWKKVLL